MPSDAWLSAFLSVGLVSLLPLLAVPAVWLSPKTLSRIRLGLVSLAVGALCGDAFIHLLPEAYASFDNELIPAFLCITGILVFLIADRRLHAHGDHCHHEGSAANGKLSPLVVIAMVGDSLHNFVDGLLIGGSYLVSQEVGIATTLAVILHEVPHEWGDIGILLHGGLRLPTAIAINLVCGVTAVLETIVALAVGHAARDLIIYLIPFGAGGFIYLAGCVLVPELNRVAHTRPRAMLDLGLILLGIGMMAVLRVVE